MIVFMLHAPVLVDVLRAAMPEYRVSRLTSRATNFLLTFLLTFLALVALGYHFFVFLPYLVGDPNPLVTLRGIAHVLFAGWLWTNVVVNYYLAVFTHPGSEPDPRTESPKANATSGQNTAGSSNRDEASSGEGGTIKPITSEEETLKQRVVAATSSTDAQPELPENPPPKEDAVPRNGMEWKPRESHFCKVCWNRVPYMDHHCPFTANCVGYGNYSYFLLWLFYMTVGLGYAIWVVFPYFNQCLLANVWAYIGIWENEPSELCEILGGHSSIILPVVGGFWLTWNMLWLQIFLLLVDLSTYNVLTNIMKLSVVRFAWHRLKGGKFLQPGSRLRVLLLNQRSNPLWFLVPVLNTHSWTAHPHTT